MTQPGFSKYAYSNIAPQYTFANVAASQTASSLIAATANKIIVVLSVAFVTGATATTAVFNSNSTAISMTFQNGINGGAVLNHNPLGWFRTTVGQALTLTTGAGSTTGVQVVYVLVGG